MQQTKEPESTHSSIFDRICFNWRALWKQIHSNSNHCLMNTYCVMDINHALYWPTSCWPIQFVILFSGIQDNHCKTGTQRTGKSYRFHIVHHCLKWKQTYKTIKKFIPYLNEKYIISESQLTSTKWHVKRRNRVMNWRHISLEVCWNWFYTQVRLAKSYGFPQILTFYTFPKESVCGALDRTSQCNTYLLHGAESFPRS